MLVSPWVVFKACDTSGRPGADAAVPRTSAPLTGIEAHTLSSFSKYDCVTALISSENNRLSLRWASCRAHLRWWLSDATERFLPTIVARFERPAKPIEINHYRHMELSPPPSGARRTPINRHRAGERSKSNERFNADNEHRTRQCK
jgi:hypothetical protein